MFGLLIFSGHALEDEAADDRDVAEFSFSHLRGVDACLYLLEQIFFGEKFIHIAVIYRYGPVAE